MGFSRQSFTRIRKVTTTANAANSAVTTNHEAHAHTAREVRIIPKPLLVAKPKPTKVLTHNTLDDLRRKPTAYAGRAHTHRRRLRPVGATQPTVTVANALTRSRTRTMTDSADVSEPDAFTAAATTLADAG